MNDIIHELDIGLDITKLISAANNLPQIDGFPNHHRLVANDEYLSEIKQKYNFLSPVVNVYKFISGQCLPIHIDADRLCCINIPICNTEHSSTIFYDKSSDIKLEYDSRRILYNVIGDTKECFRFTLSKPTLINTTYPHSVINNNESTRVILSWSILKPITFKQAISKLQVQ